MGGGGLCGLELARAFNQVEGVECSVCCLAGSKLEELSYDMGVCTRSMPDKSSSLLRAFSELIRAEEPTLIINPMHSLRQTPFVPLVLGSSASYAMLVHEAEIRPGNSTAVDRLALIAQRWETARADLCIALSRHTAIPLTKYLRCNQILTAVHPAFSATVHKLKDSVPAKPSRILFFGRSNASKGLDRLVQAFILLRGRVSAELELCLEAGTSERFKSIEGVTCLTGYQTEEELERKILCADVVALPYENASQSGVAARAMGVGCPCVATPVGGLQEQVIHGQTGYIAEDMSVEAFSRALELALTDPVQYSHMVRENLALAGGSRGWQMLAKRILTSLDLKH